MARLCGAALGLFAFSVTILLGLIAGNPADVVLLRALQAMLAFCLLGLCVGWVAYRVLDEHALRKHREMFPDEAQPGSAAGAEPADAQAPGRGPPAGGQQGAANARPVAAGR
jgi:hypothetical protein